MKIVTILGDSLSLARSENNIFFKQTYSYLLNEKFNGEYLFLNKSKRGNTTTDQINLQNIYDDISTTQSDIFIIQIGIVDCAPRIISLLEKKIIRIIFTTKNQNSYVKFKSRYRKFLTKYFPKTYVSLDVFKDNYRYLIDTILKQSSVKNILLINIADTNLNNKKKSFGFENNIINYNEIIKQFSLAFPNKINIIDLHSLSKDYDNILLEDGIHISGCAHVILANEIEKIILD